MYNNLSLQVYKCCYIDYSNPVYIQSLECDFYQCDDGSCAILREDCGNQDTEEEESNDGNSGT